MKVLSDRPLPFEAWHSEAALEPALRKAAPAYGKTFLLRPNDIRWQSDSHLLIAAGRDGTFRVAVDPKDKSPLAREFGPNVEAGSLGAHSMLGTPGRYLMTACVAHVVNWTPAQAPEPKPVGMETDFNTLIDLDLHDDRFVILGLQRLENRKLAEDGAIAWTGQVGPKLSGLRPLLISTSGPGARDTDACAPMMIGHVRFLRDGAFLIAPGGEPGVYLYDAAGKLKQTWPAETIGFDAGCPISEAEMMHFSIDDDARFRWMNGRRLLDEILPLPEGIGFVVRTREAGLTRWTLRVRSSDGSLASVPLPITSPSEFARLAGDVRGDRIAFLVQAESDPLPPPGTNRLILVQLSKPAPPAPATPPAAAKKPAPRSAPPAP